jgi:hypothetical protein
MQHVANHLSQYGRHGDDTLVHMSREEVGGLEALARAQGHGLSTNPHTGLPEAFSLKKAFKSLIAPVAGALLSPFITPMGAAAVVGGITGLAKKNLLAGLTAGLGAYGGANLAGSLANAGTTGSQLGLNPEVAAQAAKSGVDVAVPSQAGFVTSEGVKAGASQLGQQGGLSSLAQNANIWGGKAADAGYGQLAKYSMAAATPFMTQSPSGGVDMPEQMPTKFRKYDFMRTRNPYQEPGTYTGEQRYFNDQYNAYDPTDKYDYAGGGIAGLYSGGGATDSTIDSFGNVAGYAAGGRMIRGPGDGTSDSIPATINGQQPAALGDGEFVIPARIVAEIGNGSSEAGARQLYAMLSRVEQRAQQAQRGQDSGAWQELPA